VLFIHVASHADNVVVTLGYLALQVLDLRSRIAYHKCGELVPIGGIRHGYPKCRGVARTTNSPLLHLMLAQEPRKVWAVKDVDELDRFMTWG